MCDGPPHEINNDSHMMMRLGVILRSESQRSIIDTKNERLRVEVTSDDNDAG
jgi:hypothetical protein